MFRFYFSAGYITVIYCNAVFSGAPQYVMGTLQRVLNAAARLVTDTCKYDRGLPTQIHDQLHWLNVPERVEYKLAVGVWRTKHQGIWSTAALRSPTSPVDIDDQPTCTAWSFRAFSVGSPTVWNSLPVELRESAESNGVFRRTLKTILFARY